MKHPVPIADTAIDRQRRAWVLIDPSLDRYESLWECPATGAGATWAHLAGAYGVDVAFNSGRFAEVAS